ALAVAGLWLASSLRFGFDGWLEWLDKVRLLSGSLHVNNISLRQLSTCAGHAGLGPAGGVALQVLLSLLLALGVLRAARRSRPDRGAVLGILLLPVVFDPANYYLHIVFLIPLLADEPPGAWRGAAERPMPWAALAIWAAPLAMCAAEHLTLGLPTLADFRLESLLVVLCLALVLALQRPPRSPARTAS